jgi:hypothetical protein
MVLFKEYRLIFLKHKKGIFMKNERILSFNTSQKIRPEIVDQISAAAKSNLSVQSTTDPHTGKRVWSFDH